MSWLDRINNIELTIITGDGSEFTPLYKKASRTRSMNATGFEFGDIDGGLVQRGKVGIMRYPFEFIFQGDDNIEEADRFQTAALDTRPWTLIHPKYDEVLCQPVSISDNNNQENVTIVTGELWETIEDAYPAQGVDTRSKVLNLVEVSEIEVAKEFGARISTPESELIASMNNNTTLLEKLYVAKATTSQAISNVQNAANLATSAVADIGTDAVNSMRRATKLARSPAVFVDTVQRRVSTIKEAYEDLKGSVNGLSSLQEKIFFESQGASLIFTISESTVRTGNENAEDEGIEANVTDYRTRRAVLEIIETLNLLYADYLTKIGSLQSESTATPDSYIPSASGLNSLKSVVNTSSGELLKYASNAKQEREYTLQENKSLTPLVYFLTGKRDRSAVEEFVDINDLTFDQQTNVIEKGTTVNYLI